MKLRSAPSRFALLPAAFIVLLFPAFANDPTDDECEPGCEQCESGSSCEPSDDSYGTSAKYKTDPAARNTSSGDEEGSDDCEGSENNDTSNGGQNGDVYYSQGNAPANAASPGVTPRNYAREGIRFSEVRPNYVRFENVTQTVNGVDKIIRKPSQFPAKHNTVFLSDLESPGMGYQVKGCPNSRLGARDANGLRAIPAGAKPSSITIYRNPDFDPQNPYATQGRLDIIHKQRHPQTGDWVTRTIRKSSPQGNDTWTTACYLGDPSIANSAPLQAYRKIIINRTRIRTAPRPPVRSPRISTAAATSSPKTSPPRMPSTNTANRRNSPKPNTSAAAPNLPPQAPATVPSAARKPGPIPALPPSL